MRELRYLTIADDLRRRIDDGELAAGDLLPSEATLSRDHGASRVTVRRALELLRADGLVDARQGFGWFVAADPVRQTLGRLGTIEDQLASAGISSRRRIVEFRFVAPPPHVGARLGVDTVLEVVRVNDAEGPRGPYPFARITVWCPEDLGAGLSRDQVAASSFYDLLDVDIAGATQTIAAGLADAADAALLGIAARSPVLRCERVTRAAGGRAVLVSEHVFPAHLTEFVVELARPPASIAPSGLRLVEEVDEVAEVAEVEEPDSA
jgi:GntR family transcriptional regulator